MHSMILIPGSLSFAKLAMMSSAPAKTSAGDHDRYTSQDPSIHCNQCCPIQIQSRLQSVLGVRSSFVKCNKIVLTHQASISIYRCSVSLYLLARRTCSYIFVIISCMHMYVLVTSGLSVKAVIIYCIILC